MSTDETITCGETETEAGTASIAVGACIREARERARMTQASLADALGVTQTCVSYWEAGKRDPGVTELLRIAGALGVGAASLLPLPHRGPESPAPLPDGIWARVEMPGYRENTGWVTEETRFGAQAAVVRDWDGGIEAEVILGPGCRVVRLPVPLRRPGPQAALPAGDPWRGDGGEDAEDPF